MGRPYRTNPHQRMFLPFGMKLFISYLILIMVPIFIFGYMANAILVNLYGKQMTTNLTGTLAQIRDNINYKLEDTERLSDTLYFDEGMPLEIMRYEEGWVSYQTTTKQLIPKFRQTVASTNRQVWMSVYLKNETLPEIYNNDDTGSDALAKGKHWGLFHLRRIEDKPWYKSFPEEDYGKTVVWQQVDDDSRYGRISLLRRLVDTRNPTKLETIGFVRISVYLSDIFQSVDIDKIGSGSMLLILDDNSRVLYGSGNHVPDIKSDYRMMDVSGFTVLSERVPDLNWRLTALIPNTIIQQETRKINILTIVICLASFGVILLVALGVSRFFSKRVSKVVSVLSLFQQGDFHKRVHYKGNDEFTLIAESLNKLGEHTEHLIEEVYMTNLKKKEAELETLQAQINPHFLYNTLSSISRLAKFGQVDKQHQMVMNLAKFYRLTLNDGQTIIAIHKEMEQTQAYIDIQKVKYGDRMDVEFNIEPSIVNFVTVKVILQPFLENAMQHAWCGDRIYIRISGFYETETDSICFEIMDDGNGMRKEMLQQVITAMNQPVTDKGSGRGRGYGIRNVNERIKLYFGKEYGVQLFSRPGIGTTVWIRIPVQRAKQQASERIDAQSAG
ncbi:sensor histidine kinase [Paenibacillus sp. SAF-054]